MSEAADANRLISEKSPYLQQHAYNPVDWRPWCEEALEEARAKNLPIFLSIGYSTCHWCHVMERESFEDLEVAAVLNANYISVKVDREERPDVDHVYMMVCQAITGKGGWPMTMLLTPDATPFFAGTYLPKLPRGGAPGLLPLLEQAAKLWRENPAQLVASGEKVVSALHEITSAMVSDEVYTVDSNVLAQANAHFVNSADAEFGGFGQAPKFPSPHQVAYLLEQYRHGGDKELLAISCRTLDAMRAGGIWDHFGFGFHRYATDREWLTPHFEKMLYDQAGLALLYAKGYSLTGVSDYALTARQTLTYIERELSDPAGGFYCGEDADSEGEEGLFYIWALEEVEELLGRDGSREFCAAYDISERGNYMEEGTGKPTDKNIPNLMNGLQKGELSPGWTGSHAEKFAKELTALFDRRQQRIRPFKDDKVLTSWSAFAASAFAVVGASLGDCAMIERARKAVEFLTSTMEIDGKLMRRYRDGDVSVAGFAEDYAFLARAQLDLYAATWEERYLTAAAETALKLWQRFSSEDGALFDTAEDAERLIFRPREATDGAMPSATSVAVECFARLGLLTGESGWDEKASSVISAHGKSLASYPHAFSHLLQAAAYLHPEAKKIEATGDRTDPGAKELFAFMGEKTPYSAQTLFHHTEGAATVSIQVCDRTACLYTATTTEELSRRLIEDESEA
jgi:uncharacterized protein YyaL (SSP411 family)